MDKSVIPFGTVKIGLLDYASRANGIIGIRDSGKTSTAQYLAEEIEKRGVPFFAFDPSGAWASLRYPGKGPGLPVVVVGDPAEGADLKLQPESVAPLIEAAMRDGISVVFDLSGRDFSKADWRRMVTSAVTTLLAKNKAFGLRHLFIEEAAEFIPQRALDMVTYGAVEKLVRIGGNHRLGVTLINQRSQEMAKSVLELCDNLFLHRQKGKNSIQNIDKWLDVAEVEDTKHIVSRLSSLPTGECFVWLGQTLTAVNVKVPMKASAYIDRRVLRADLDAGAVKAKAVDVGGFVEAMTKSLGKIKEESDANDPAKLRARIRELERAQAKPAGDKDALAAEYRRGYSDGNIAAADAVTGAMDRLQDATLKALGEASNAIARAFSEARKAITGQVLKAPPKGIGHVLVAPPPSGMRIERGESFTNGADHIAPPLQKIIDAISWWNAFGVSDPAPPQVAFIAGYSHKGGTWSTYLSRLRSLGLIEPRGFRLTPAGAAHAADIVTPRSREELHRAVAAQIAEPLQKIMRPLLDAEGAAVSIADVAAAAGYSSAGGTWSTYLSRLRSLDLIAKGSRDGLRAQEWLFP